MQKILLILAAFLMAGCAQYGGNGYDYAAKQERMRQWRQTAQQERNSGHMSYSTYYKQMYSHVAEFPVTDVDIAAMERLDILIAAAKKMEAGEMSKDEFDAAVRKAEIGFNKSLQAIQQKQAYQAQMRAASRPTHTYQPYILPQPYMMQSPKTTTTNCYTIGNNINCTTR